MHHLFGLLHMVIFCGTLMGIVFIVALALPQSRLRALLLPFAAWGVAIFCAIWAISPIDLVPEALLGPFGLVDDVGAVVAGVMAARTAINASKQKKKDVD